MKAWFWGIAVWLSLVGIAQGNNTVYTFNGDVAGWGGAGKLDRTVRYHDQPSVKVADTSTGGGDYAVSPVFNLKPGSDYELSGWVKTDGKVTSGSVIYLRITDAAGKTLAFFETNTTKSADWENLSCDIDADRLPKTAAQGQLMLQPAKGAATETGTAWYADIQLQARPSENMENQKTDEGNVTAVPAANIVYRSTGSLRNWGGAGKLDRIVRYHDRPSIKVADTSTGGGDYAVSPAFPLTPGRDYELSGWVKTDGKVTSGSVIYLRVADAADKTLAFFETNPTRVPDWVKLCCLVPADKLPKTATQGQFMLQPAKGPAAETGTAWYADLLLQVRPVADFKVPGGKEITGEIFIKASSNAMPEEFNSPDLLTDPNLGSSWRPLAQDRTPWLELSWCRAIRPAALWLRPGNGTLGTVKIRAWDDRTGEWQSATAIQAVPEATGYDRIDLADIPETRKLLLQPVNPPGGLEICDLHLLARPELRESWQASWIWDTAERVEYVRRYFRKTFTVDEPVASAWLLGTGDDNVEFCLNGKPMLACGEWRRPQSREISADLVPGENVITGNVYNARYAAGMIAEIDLKYKSGKSRKILSDAGWLCSTTAPDGWMKPGFRADGWAPSVMLGIPPRGGWGEMPYVNHAEPQAIRLLDDSLPTRMSAGKNYRLQLTLQPQTAIATASPVYLILRRSGRDFIRQRLDDGAVWSRTGHGAVTLTAEITLSAYLYPGQYELTLEAPYCRVIRDGKTWFHSVTVANERKAATPTAVIRKVNGMPILHLDGQPYWSMLYTRQNESDPDVHPEFARNGLRFVQCYIMPDMPAPGKYDFAEVDRLATEILTTNPAAMIVMKPEFRDSVPAWFAPQYPDELSQFDAGGSSGKPSLASEEWRKIAGDMLRALIRHIRSGPYADKVMGYFVCEGEEGQWMHYWGGDDLTKDNIFSDYSPAMRRYFSQWLKKKYGSAAELQSAWQDNKVTFDTATIPSRRERLQAGKGMFRDPKTGRKAIDYAEALSDVVGDGIAYYARIVKEETERKGLMLAFYGHIMDLGAGFLGEQVGYLKQRREVNCPDVDYYAGPISYAQAFRDLGGTASFDYPSPATLRLQNKIWLNEDDLRTHLTNPPGYAYSVRRANQTDQVMAREFAKALCGGAGLYWFNLSGGQRNWFDDPQTVRTMGLLNKIGNQAVTRNLSSVSQIAVITSDRALLYVRPLQLQRTEDTIMLQCILGQREQLGRIGAPFDEYLPDDLLDPAMPDYKFYVFLNAFYLTRQERDGIVRKLRKNGATALWIYAPGVIDENGWNPAGSRDVTGITLEMDSAAGQLRMTMRPDNTLCPGSTAEFGMPNDQTQAPRFTPAAGGDYRTLAVVAGSNKPGLVHTDFRGISSYYCAVPIIPAEILRAMAKHAGVTIYSSDNDAIYACKDYLSIHTGNQPGPRTLTLPTTAWVTQVYPPVTTKPAPMVSLGKGYRVYPPAAAAPVQTREIRFNSVAPETRIYLVTDNK